MHAAGKSGGVGYGHIYHIYLPHGTDACADASDTVCYLPDHPSTFVLCAYHASDTFTDIGHVLFSVEPFQNIPGCAIALPGPNGQLADSTIGKKDGSAHGGHLPVEAHIRPTCEVILTESPIHLQKQIGQESGLALIRP